MRRQLYSGGGITNIPRQGYGLGSWVKKRIRKLIPNELADVAVKAAPFVAPFNPGIAGLMRGIGRFDQRGSMSDALKQGLLTYGGGQLARQLGGAGYQEGFGEAGARFTSPLSEGRMEGVRDFFSTPERSSTPKALEKGSEEVGIKGIRDAAKHVSKIPGLGNISDLAKQQLLVGTVSGGLTYIYEKFIAEEPEQQPGETYGEFLARRKKNVAQKMRAYKDNYLAFDKDWSSMTDEEKNEQIQRDLTEYDVEDANMNQGGRVGLFGGGEAGIKSLDAGAPDITYEGNEGPQAPQQMADALLREEYDKYVYDLLEIRPEATPMSFEEFRQMVIAEGKMSGGQPLPEDPTKPVNPWTPKPTGPVLPNKQMAAQGGRIGAYGGGVMGIGTPGMGLPGIPRMAPDGMEYDMSVNGGFQPLGAKEGKDDVKANLAKNEFVFTADAVRGAGNGDIELGAQKMYDTMKNLEKRMA